jgi:hypothetical protein
MHKKNEVFMENTQGHVPLPLVLCAKQIRIKLKSIGMILFYFKNYI